MALMHTPACDHSFKAIDFSLKATDGKNYSLSDIEGEAGTIVMFISNHCPYVKIIADRMVLDMRELQALGFGVIAIMSNDTKSYPEDSFDNMKRFAERYEFSFPYVIDETQNIARAYDAVCTPDFFGFDADFNLVYRGRLDAVNPSKPAQKNTKHELLEAMIALKETGVCPKDHHASMGCSIKWL